MVGLVEPYDGFDLMRLDPKNPPKAPWTIQPANPELLEALAEDFRTHNYSIHRVIKTIMKSNAYQLSASFPGEWKDAYVPYYARRFARVLTGPEAVDIVTQATGSPYDAEAVWRKSPVRQRTHESVESEGRRGWRWCLTRALLLRRTLIFSFMQAYYQGERAMPPVDKNIASPVQAMMMMTSPVVTKRVSAEGDNRVANLLKSGKSDDEMPRGIVPGEL